ncbi:MAG: NAD(P)H-dependent glycerol-3-phosphate dehydrogenase [Pseudomonadota bacterium]
MIGIMGAGAFGTALAVSYSSQGAVVLWSRDAQAVTEMTITRRNHRYLPDVILPETVRVTARTSDLDACDAILISVPTQKLRDFMTAQGASLGASVLVACCKGAEVGTGLGPTGIIRDCKAGVVPALLTGPSFATDIARGLPTALCIAAEDPDVRKQLQHWLSVPQIRVYRTADVVGAELGGALKNVIAIACGAAIGAGLGESARAALMTRGFAEMIRLARLRGARAETLAGLSGFGDLVLTCASEQSRNFRFGHSLGAEKPFDPGITVEGAATAKALACDASLRDVELPILRAVHELASGELKVSDAIDKLLSRPLKEE